MDSVSQLVLGAAVSYAVLGHKLGKRSLIIGAAVGTLPDLDVLVAYSDAVESFTRHRSWSHSLFVLSAISWPLAYLLRWRMPGADLSMRRWWLGIWLVLITHPLLDGFTIYGTQIAWPLDVKPAAIGSIFIIDPLYTLPLIIAVVIAWRGRFDRGYRAVLLGLSLSTAYLAWTVHAQGLVRSRLQDTLADASIQANTLLVAPFPFSLLWRTVAVNEENYYEGFASLLDSQDAIEQIEFNSGINSCADLLTHWPVQRMLWFTDGAMALSRRNNELIVSDLRMGIENNYVFEFSVAEWQDQQWQPSTSQLLPMSFDSNRVRLLFQRITDQSISLKPDTRELDGC